MSRIRFAVTSAAVALAAGFLAPSAPAQNQPGGRPSLPYPAKSPIVVQLNGLDRVRERLGKMLDTHLPESAAKLKKDIDGGLGQLLAGRKTTAVPKDARMFLVVNDIAKLFDDEPAFAAIIPVTGYAQFRETFLTADERKTFEKGADGVDSIKSTATGDEVTVYLVDHKGYVVLTPSKATAEVYAGKFIMPTAADMGSDLATTFLRSDVAVYVNIDAINDLYGDQIRQFKQLMDFAIGQAAEGGMIPGVNKKQLEQGKVMIAGLFQAFEDCQGIVAGAEIKPDGVGVRVVAKFAPDSISGKLLKTENPGPLADLGRLPFGLTTYSASRFGPKFGDLMRVFVGEAAFAAPNDDDKGAEVIARQLADLGKAGPQGDFTAATTPDTSATVAFFKNPALATAATVKLYQAMAAGGRVQNVLLKDRPRVTENAQTYRGFTFAEIRVRFDLDGTVQDLPEAVRDTTLATLKKTIHETMTYWVGTNGKVMMTLGAKDWAAARAVLDGYLDGKGADTDPGFRVTRKNLPADATLIYMTETRDLIMTGTEYMKMMANLAPGALPPIAGVKPVKGEATYLGIALTLKADTATLDVFLPGAGLNAAYKMLSPLFRNIE